MKLQLIIIRPRADKTQCDDVKFRASASQSVDLDTISFLSRVTIRSLFGGHALLFGKKYLVLRGCLKMPFLSSFLIKTNLVIQSRSKIPFLRLPCD